MDSHLKIPAIRPRIQYIADGVQTVFVFPFPVFEAEDMEVYRNAARIGEGFDVEGVGDSDGGRVVFQSPPAEGERVTLRRQMRIRRMTDFLQGSDMRADSFNDEFDRLTAITQELSDALDRSIAAPVHEDTFSLVLPTRDMRRNTSLVFNADGDLTVVAAEGPGLPTPGLPDPVAPEASVTTYSPAVDGSVGRSVAGRLAERLSVRDFGAVGDGSTDDTPAFLAAMARSAVIYVPRGEYRITQTIPLWTARSLIGAGPSSRLIMSGASSPLLDIRGDRCQISGLTLINGSPAVRCLAEGRRTDFAVIKDTVIENAGSGVILETAGSDTCHGVRISGVRMSGLSGPGVWVTGQGSSAPTFLSVRDVIIAPSEDASGAAVLIDHVGEGSVLSGIHATAPSAGPAVQLGPGALGLALTGIVTRRHEAGVHILVDAGVTGTVVTNHRALGPGAAIGGDGADGLTVVLGAGGDTRIPDLAGRLWRFADTRSITPGTPGGTSFAFAAWRGLQFIDARNGPVVASLPPPDKAKGTLMVVKKIDDSPHSVTVTDADGAGPDGRPVRLADRFDYAAMVSDGVAWRMISDGGGGQRTERRAAVPGETLTLNSDIYLLEAPTGAPGTISLPNAANPAAIGRRVTVKMTGGGSMGLMISEVGGAGPDGAEVYLMQAGASMTAVSDGVRWEIVART